jgi:hypothetical protein
VRAFLDAAVAVKARSRSASSQPASQAEEARVPSSAGLAVRGWLVVLA